MLNFPAKTDLALLVIRIGLGAMFILHGLPKIAGGPEAWTSLGQYGLPFLSGSLALVAGLAAAMLEFFGGILLALGLFHRWICLGLIATMLVAFRTHLGEFEGIMDFARTAGWPLELTIVFAGLFLAGPGIYRVRIGKQAR